MHDLRRQSRNLTSASKGCRLQRESEYVWSDIWHLEAHHPTALEARPSFARGRSAAGQEPRGRRKTEDAEPLPEEPARLHDSFEKVHPFIDGNGRTGRLPLNLLQVRLGYPPVIMLKQQRPADLAAMQKADAGDYGPLGKTLARYVRQPQPLYRAVPRGTSAIGAAGDARRQGILTGSPLADSAARSSGCDQWAGRYLAQQSQGRRGLPAYEAAPATRIVAVSVASNRPSVADQSWPDAGWWCGRSQPISQACLA